jgi:hypothetical protein
VRLVFDCAIVGGGTAVLITRKIDLSSEMYYHVEKRRD